MKYIILVGDGMGDYPMAELGDKTPLEAAATPAMDRLARQGSLFTIKTVPDGMHPGSDVANLSLLGYLPEKVYSGRAPLEAASMHVAIPDNSMAYRCNLVTIARQGDDRVTMVDYSAGHISTEEACELIGFLADRLGSDTFQFHAGVSYRHLLIVANDADLETVPPHDFTDKDVSLYWRNYQESFFGDLLIQASALLEAHPINQKRVAQGLRPANSIWLWGQGTAPAMATLNESFGISGALISAVDLLKGIGVYAGMEIIDVPGATGYLDTNYQGKAEAALAALNRHDLVFVHVEAPDEAGHQGLLKEKIQAIEDFDRQIVTPIVDGLHGKYDFRLAVTCDHFTPISLKTHDAHPVPVVILDSTAAVVASGAENFSEAGASAAATHFANGEEFFKHLLLK